jgi:hypothetical protein
MHDKDLKLIYNNRTLQGEKTYHFNGKTFKILIYHIKLFITTRTHTQIYEPRLIWIRFIDRSIRCDIDYMFLTNQPKVSRYVLHKNIKTKVLTIINSFTFIYE